MSNLCNIDDIKREHYRLYEIVIMEVPKFLIEAKKELPSQDIALDSTKFLEQFEPHPHLLKEVDQLLTAMKVLFSTSTSLEDNLWLINATVLWTGVFTSIFNIPRIIALGEPPKHLLPSLPSTTGSGLTEQELNEMVNNRAKYFEVSRLTKEQISYSDKEWQTDIRLANTFLASETLDGKINFARRLSSSSYYRLEQFWLKDIKDFRAYFVWLERRGEFNDGHRKEDYLQVCDHIRNMLVNEQIKALPMEFGEARQYLENQYLNKNMEIDEDKTRGIIQKKAYRMGELQGIHDGSQDWADAKAYVKMFYENIIPAVLDNDPEAVLAVLKAFQFTGAGHKQNIGEDSPIIIKHHVVNCFEVTLATYFISPKLILEHWKAAKENVDVTSAFDSNAPFSGNTESFNIPSGLREKLWFSEGCINFKGVMKQPEKEKLIASNPGFNELIEKLYENSRLIHKKFTL